jgi:ABC-type proline/glycine betaine transport system substrate-binding protein
MRAVKFFCVFVFVALSAAKAQSPAPIIVQAASPVTTNSTASKTSAAAPMASSVPDAIKLLEKMKTDNDEVLAKQKAVLERLDELQQAADELRIFSKRG